MQLYIAFFTLFVPALVPFATSAIRTSIEETTINGLASASIAKLLVQPVGRVKRQQRQVQEQDEHHHNNPTSIKDTTNKPPNKTKVATSRTPAPARNTTSTSTAASSSSSSNSPKFPPPSPSASSPSPSPPPSSATGANELKLVMKLLRAGKLEDCAGQVVCDLNCDPARYGPNGIRIADLMTQVQRSGIMGLTDSSYLVTAGLAGKMYYWTAGCHRCKQVYAHCFTDSKSLMQLVSFIDLDRFKFRQTQIGRP